MLGSLTRTITVFILIITMLLMLLGRLISGMIPSKPDETTTSATTTATQPVTEPATATTTEPTTQPTTQPVTEPTATSKETTTEGGVLIRDIEKLPVTVIEGSGADIIRGADAASDGGFVICGTSTSTDGWFAEVAKGALNSTYSFVAKLNQNGAAVWKQQYTSAGETVVLSDIATLGDGGFLAVGYAYRTGSYDAAATAALAIKYTVSGNIEWVKRYSGSGHSLFNGVTATPDGFAVSGNTTALDGTFEGNRAEPSASNPLISQRSSGFILSLDGSGNIKWKEFFCGSKGSSMGGVSSDGDGNIFAACMTSSTDGDFARFASLIGGYNDSIAYKFSADGKFRWGYCVATSGIDKFDVIEADGEGGCLLGGTYELRGIPAPDGTLSGVHHCGGKTDALVIRIGGSGDELWMRAISGYYEDQINDIRRTEGGFAVIGCTKSGDREFNTVGNLGEYDAFVDFLTPGGNRAAIASQAGSANDMANCVAISGSTVRVFGQTSSSDGSFTAVTSAAADKFSGYSAGYRITVK